MADTMMGGKAARREDFFNDGASDSDGSNEGGLALTAEDANAAQAALDAYMASTFGLDLTAKPKPKPTPKPKAQQTPTEPRQSETHDSSNYGDDDDAQDAQSHTDTLDAASEPTKSEPTGFAFRLFGGPATYAPTTGGGAAGGDSGHTASAPNIVVLEEEVIIDNPFDSWRHGDQGGLANPPRPLSTYVAGPPTPEELARYAQAAVEGDAIRAQAAPDRRAWGLEVPWRARTAVRVSKEALGALLANALVGPAAPPPKKKKSKAGAAGSAALLVSQAPNALPAWALAGTRGTVCPAQPVSAEPPKHRRPGKKRRIAQRQRDQARREKEEADTKQQLSKEEHLLEKKRRLNRIKKMRKREKKRSEKAEGGGGDAADGADQDSVDGNSDKE